MLIIFESFLGFLPLDPSDIGTLPFPAPDTGAAPSRPERGWHLVMHRRRVSLFVTLGGSWSSAGAGAPSPAFPSFCSIILFHMIVHAFDKLTHWKFQSIEWNPRYSEKVDSSERFARTFRKEQAELINSLLINLLLAVFYRQSLSCEVIDKSQGES